MKTTSLLLITGWMFLGFTSCKGCAQHSVVQENVSFETNATAGDSLIFYQLGNYLSDKDTTLTGYIDLITMFFLETPYVASTLETEGEESLVINLREMDCTTFVEYVSALALCFNSGDNDFSAFASLLGRLRYRDGIIYGYCSRLHYFSDWMHDNKDKGLLKIISDSIGNEAFDSRVSFMTDNPQYYRQLKEQPILIDTMKVIEERVSGYQMRFITKNNIEDVAYLINNGDIISFVTSIPGLDVSHTGFAKFKDGRLFLIHASTRTNKVEITPVPLSDYLAERSRVTGIMVARLIEK
jgi:hypothetical protein